MMNDILAIFYHGSFANSKDDRYLENKENFVNEYASSCFQSIRIKGNDSLQPASYENDRFWFAFHGEIYNLLELQRELAEKGYPLAAASELDIIAALLDAFQREAFSRLRGKFSMIIWDKKQKTAYGVRDPFGMKQLLYYQTKQFTAFAFDKRSLALLFEKEEVHPIALQHYMSYQYVPEPMTITTGIKKVEPGYYFAQEIGKDLQWTRYWRATFYPVVKEKDAWVKDIRDALYQSVELHMRGKDSIGSFLSGGIDSTFLVSIAKEWKPDIKTFSVGFEREGYSEIDIVRETAESLDVENIAYILSPDEFIESLPEIMWHIGDPLADPACIPLYFVAREAKKYVDIALSGEGSDELFGGYNIYREPEALKVFRMMPNSILNMLSKLAEVIPEGVKGKSFLERGTTPLRERYIGNAKIFEEAEKRELLQQYHEQHTYQTITSQLYDTAKDYDLVSQMQYIDIHTWMRGDILLKADRVTTANSLEVRLPFLDKKVFQVASKLPANIKVANGTTKYILREAAKGIVPDHVLHRKKLGFPVPIRHWLKDEMYAWATKLIAESQTDYLLKKDYVFRLLDEHAKGHRDYSRKIWTVLMFMLWHQIFIEKEYDFTRMQPKGKKLEPV